jgi:hypothetical protein
MPRATADPRGRAIETTLPQSGSTRRTRYTEEGLLQRIERETAAGTREQVYAEMRKVLDAAMSKYGISDRTIKRYRKAAKKR